MVKLENYKTVITAPSTVKVKLNLTRITHYDRPTDHTLTQKGVTQPQVQYQQQPGNVQQLHDDRLIVSRASKFSFTLTLTTETLGFRC